MLTEFEQVESLRQIVTFCWAVGYGGLLALLAGPFFSAVGGRRRGVRRFVADLAAGCCLAVAVFCFLQVRCGGSPRAFALLGMAAGAAAAFGFLLPPLGRFWRAVKAKMRRFTGRLARPFLPVLAGLRRVFLAPRSRACRKRKNPRKNILKFRKKPLAISRQDDV